MFLADGCTGGGSFKYIPVLERDIFGIKVRVYKHCKQEDITQRCPAGYPCILIHAHTPQVIVNHEVIWNSDESVAAIVFTYAATGNYAFSKFYWADESWIQSRMLYQKCFEVCGNSLPKDFRNNVNNGKNAHIYHLNIVKNNKIAQIPVNSEKVWVLGGGGTI